MLVGGSTSQLDSDPSSNRILATMYFRVLNSEFYVEHVFQCSSTVQEFFEFGTKYKVELGDAIIG